jgi:hypothetical protein
MSDPNENLFNEWRVADRQAHAMEQALTRASLEALEGRGEPPSAQERAQAHKLRRAADDLFQLAMEEMRARASANRW